jgi:hypothetical protein
VWNGQYSEEFRVTRGIRQGSILSPLLFIMFTDDLLKELSGSSFGVRVSRYLFNNLAYADDVNILASSVPGVQGLIDICAAYARRWRFVFGIKNTRCIIFGKEILAKAPVWHLDNNVITNA